MHKKIINNNPWINGIYYYKDPNYTILHRENGPAIEYANGNKEWYLSGKLHREDGPAIEYSNGDKEWYLNGVLHQEDGPAIEYHDGHKEWWINGKCHREDGPAVEDANRNRFYYLNNEEFSKEKYIQYIKNKAICLAKQSRILKRCI